MYCDYCGWDYIKIKCRECGREDEVCGCDFARRYCDECHCSICGEDPENCMCWETTDDYIQEAKGE